MKQRARIRDYDDHPSYDRCSDDEDAIELSPKGAKSTRHYLEADVLNGDTLQAVALRFNCSVESLKKANGIHKENEIFAKGKLKIPVSAFSLLTESIPAVHTSGNNSPTKSSRTENDRANVDLQQKLIIAAVNTAEVQPSSSRSPDVELYNGVNSESTIIDESVPLMVENVSQTKATIEDVVLNEFITKGADLGINWFFLLLFFIAIIVIVPLLYVFYIAEHHQSSHHHGN